MDCKKRGRIQTIAFSARSQASVDTHKTGKSARKIQTKSEPNQSICIAHKSRWLLPFSPVFPHPCHSRRLQQRRWPRASCKPQGGSRHDRPGWRERWSRAARARCACGRRRPCWPRRQAASSTAAKAQTRRHWTRCTIARLKFVHEDRIAKIKRRSSAARGLHRHWDRGRSLDQHAALCALHPSV